ncbi:hypothetical protein C8T65DRAFT_730476 [Cerioporus squamosus]|nr:hypothetical protein C8T65DRAFT_730476 [Cerioporus squamosus]
MADECHIAPLIRSVLYQKRALGHELPAICIRYSSASPSTYQVLFAWLDDSSTSDGARVHVAAPRLVGSAPDGLFNLEQRSEAYAFMQFLEVVSDKAMSVRTTRISRMFVQPELFWRADEAQYERFGPSGGKIEAWRGHVSELRPLDEPLFSEKDRVSEEDREKKYEKIMMKKPVPRDIVLSVAQWSLDHRVLTLSLLRKGPVHKRHTKVLNRYFKLMYPLPSPHEIRQETSPSEVGHGGFAVRPGESGYDPRYHPALEVLSMLAKEEAWQKSVNDSVRTLELWDDAMSWCFGLLRSEPGLVIVLDFQLCNTQVNYLRCAEYDAVLPSEPEGLVQMPHTGRHDKDSQSPFGLGSF